MAPSITLNLACSIHDDVHGKGICQTVQDLVDGSVSPKAAAQNINQTIVQDCNDAFEAYTKGGSNVEAGPDPVAWQVFAIFGFT